MRKSRGGGRDEVQRRLRLLRTGAGKSQIEVEHEAGLPRGKYWRIENGYDTPTHDELKQLARVFGVSESKVSSAVAT